MPLNARCSLIYLQSLESVLGLFQLLSSWILKCLQLHLFLFYKAHLTIHTQLCTLPHSTYKKIKHIGVVELNTCLKNLASRSSVNVLQS